LVNNLPNDLDHCHDELRKRNRDLVEYQVYQMHDEVHHCTKQLDDGANESLHDDHKIVK